VLPAAARVRRSADFVATFKGGQRARRGTLVVHVARRKTPTGSNIDPERRDIPHTESPESARRDGPADRARAGFVVSKAVGPAVVRNRVKRRLRHVVAERIDGWPSGLDVVVRALPDAAAADYRQLGSDMDAAFAAASRRRR
jgi:ribonuclease P protein component